MLADLASPQLLASSLSWGFLHLRFLFGVVGKAGGCSTESIIITEQWRASNCRSGISGGAYKFAVYGSCKILAQQKQRSWLLECYG